MFILMMDALTNQGTIVVLIRQKQMDYSLRKKYF